MRYILLLAYLFTIVKSIYAQSPCPEVSTISYEGKIYHTVLIGKQCWLKENLNVGKMIISGKEQSDNGVIEKYCYDNKPENCSIYGGLYLWNEGMRYVTKTNLRGICPSGWHIPTLVEFQTLATAVSYDGDALKAVVQGTGSSVGTNTSGFSALLAGYRTDNGYFLRLGGTTYFWSSTEYIYNYAYDLSLTRYGSNVYLGYGSKDYGVSVRCIKDD